MNAYTDKGFNREIVIYCKDTGLHDPLIDFLQGKQLDLTHPSGESIPLP